MLAGILLALGAASAWAHNSIVYTFAGKRVSSLTTAHVRMWFALPMALLIQFLITGNLLPQIHSPLTWLMSALSGLVGYFLADILIFSAFLHLGPRDTMLVMTTSPVFSGILSFLVYGERLPGISLLAAIIMLAGIALVISDSDKTGRKVLDLALSPEKRKGKKLTGLMLALGGALTQALGIVLAKYSLDLGDHPVEVNVIRLSAGFLSFLVFQVFRRQLVPDFRKMRDRRALLLIAFGALVGPSLGVLGALYAVLFIPVGLASVLMQTTPVILLPVERLFFRRTIQPRAVVGTLVALAGIALLIFPTGAA